MNELEQYALMCETSKEVQKQWGRKSGDVYYSPNESLVFEICKHIEIWNVPKDAVWLPREEDLWAMLTATHTLCAKISMFHEFYDPEFYCPESTAPCKACSSLGKHRRTTFTTLKQFLLAFVMEERWKKAWDGKSWIKEVK